MLRHNKRLLDKILLRRCEAYKSIQDDQRRFLARAVRSTTAAAIRSRDSFRDDDLPTSPSSNQISSTIIDQQNSDQNDYLGIREVDDSVIVHGEYGYEEKEAHREQLMQKYKPLLDPKKNKKNSTGVEPSAIKRTWFGQIRLDSENIPLYHGEYERKEDMIAVPGDGSRQRAANPVANIVRHMEQHQITSLKKEEDSSIEKDEYSYHSDKPPKRLPEIDENIPVVESKMEPKSLLSSRIAFRYANDFAASLKKGRIWSNQKKKNEQKNIKEESSDWIAHEAAKHEKDPVLGAPVPEENLSTLTEQELSQRMAAVKLGSETAESPLFEPPQTLTGIDYLKEIYSGKRTAHFQEGYDQLKKLINKKEVLDSKGFRILKNQVPDYSAMTNDDIVDVLYNQILYNDSDIVALNKPYGMSIHGSGEGKESVDSGESKSSTSRVKGRFNSYLHLNYFLPELAGRLGVEKLYTVHRLDRDTTGVLLLTKTQAKAHELARLFKEHRIEKKYLCITKNCPDIREGVIDIPVELGYIKSPDGAKRERMVLCPEPVEDIRAHRRPARTARQAITRYRVVSEAGGNAALLEVFPQTGVRHQIRVHLGFGIRCPILGDHKYSNLDSLTPQRLPADMLNSLKVRQQKVRHVPMHLHAYLCTIPQAGVHGTNVFVRAPLPHHFRKNMTSLKLKMD